MFIDSHCHLDRLDYTKIHQDFDAMLNNAKRHGVNYFLSVCITLDEFQPMLSSILPYPEIFASCGVHPLEVKEGFEVEQLTSLATHPRVVAIGETGLDYYYSQESKKQQQKSFAQHIDVAKDLNKPLIVHTRDAREDTLKILKNQQAHQCQGVLHCFTESLEMAQAAMDMGFYISISGIVTFKQAQSLREVVKALPLNRLLIETDSPYLAPAPYRGKENQPAYVKYVAEYIANLKEISLETLAYQTSQNFFDLFTFAKR